MKSTPIKPKHLVEHETKRKVLRRFFLVLLVVISYGFFVVYQFGAELGLIVTALTWSFFVLCTPIADAGFLLDFPIRLITNLKMIVSEALVWLIAILLNIYFVFERPEVYQSNSVLKLFYQILTNPYPYWAIIALSFVGTFLSIIFADELVDSVKEYERVVFKKHKKAHKLVVFFAVFALTLVFYYELVHKMGLSNILGF